MGGRPRDGGASLEAIEAVYRARFGEFHRLAVAITGDREAARDAVQDGFATAVRRRGTFRGQGALEAWLWRIVINATRSQQRASRRAPRHAREPRPSGHLEAADDRVATALAALPERQRLVLFLHYYADLDYAAIAAALEISSGTVAATLHSARARMRRLLEEREAIP